MEYNDSNYLESGERVFAFVIDDSYQKNLLLIRLR